MKIYIVEISGIEDHGNLAVCTTLEKAKEFLAKCDVSSGYTEYLILEYETDVWCNYPHFISSNGLPEGETEVLPVEICAS